MKTFFTCIFILNFFIPCTQTTPYNVHKKPIPSGTNWSKILPNKSEKYTLVSFKRGYDISSFSAEYVNTASRIKLTGYYRSSGEINLMNLPPPPVDSNEPPNPCKEETGDGYQLTVCPDFTAFSYDKGSSRVYHFSVTAQSRQELDRFMKTFPY